MPPPPGIPEDVRHFAGPLIVTFLLSSILYGVHIIQVYLYFLSFPKDRTIIKSVVYLVFAITTAQTGMFFRDAYLKFGSGFGDMKLLGASHLSGMVPTLTGLAGVLVQGFYAYQIFVISRSKFLAASILSIGMVQFIAAIIEGVYGFMLPTPALLQQTRAFVPCLIWLGGSALCDTFIAVLMTYYLMKASTGLKSSHIINRLVRLVVETGSLTATVAIIDLILFVSLKKYPYHMIPSRSLAKLYGITLMVILNSRMRIRGSRDESQVDEIYTGDWSQNGTVSIRFAGGRNTTTMGGEFEPETQGETGMHDQRNGYRSGDQVNSTYPIIVPLTTVSSSAKTEDPDSSMVAHKSHTGSFD